MSLFVFFSRDAHYVFFDFFTRTVSLKDRCRLYCRVEQSSAYYLLKDKVADGTVCSPDTDDICVNGICKPASCNHVLGKTKKLGKSCPLIQFNASSSWTRRNIFVLNQSGTSRSYKFLMFKMSLCTRII